MKKKENVLASNMRATSRLLNLSPVFFSFILLLFPLSKTQILRMLILRIASLRFSFCWLVAIMGVGPTRLLFLAGARVAEDERK